MISKIATLYRLASNPAYGQVTRSHVEKGPSLSRHSTLKVKGKSYYAPSYVSPPLFFLCLFLLPSCRPPHSSSLPPSLLPTPLPPFSSFFFSHPPLCIHYLIPSFFSTLPPSPFLLLLSCNSPPPLSLFIILPLILLPSLLISPPPTPLLSVHSATSLSLLHFLFLLSHC